MKLTGNRLQIDHTPLSVSGNLHIEGGTGLQFFDGNSYVPNREGVPSSPIIISHIVSFVDPDGVMTLFPYSTLFYEDNILITASTQGYELIGSSQIKVVKNTTPGTAVTIKAVSQMLDSRSGKVYTREDVTYLRTIIKDKAPYQLELTPSGRQFFDGYRNPNQKTTIVATVNVDGENIASYTGITFKWLNSDVLDVIVNELYGDVISADGRTLTIDKTYIDRELIKCEAWKDDKMIASDTVTLVRRFNQYLHDIVIVPGDTFINCILTMRDTLGEINVDSAFLVTWYSQIGNATPIQIGVGADIKVPKSQLNLKVNNLQVYPDIRRREAWAALETSDGFILVDNDDNVLTVEDYGI